MKHDLRKQWYSRPDVLQQIIGCIKEREVSFMVPMTLRKEKGNYPVRCVKAHHSSYLLRNMQAFDFFNREYNLYHSIYVLQDMPMFTFHPLQRSEQQKEFFKKYDTYIKGLDFVMDFDGDKTLELSARVEKAREQTMKVCALLDTFKVPYCVMFSGSKGFHVEVRGFPPTQEWNKRTRLFQEVASLLVLLANGIPVSQAREQLQREDFAEYMKDLYSFDSSIYNVTRIWKVPYSYETSTDMIVLPLSAEELKNFKLQNCTVEQQLQQNHWNKGLKNRPGTIHNFWEMAKKMKVTT